MTLKGIPFVISSFVCRKVILYHTKESLSEEDSTLMFEPCRVPCYRIVVEVGFK